MSARTLRLARYLVRTANVDSRIEGILAQPQFKKANPKSLEKLTKLLKDLATVDPTGDQGTFLTWIFRNVNLKDPDQKIDWPNDRERVRRALASFLKLKKEPRYFKQYEASSDINTYKLRALEALNRKIFGQSHLQKTQEAPASEKLSKGVSLFYQDSEFKVYRVGGPGTTIDEAVKAACEFGEGTEWCTAGEESAHSYMERGPLYVIYRKGVKIAQTDGNELKNVDDDSIMISQNPEIWEKLVEFGVFTPGRFAYEYASKVVRGRWPEGEKDLLDDEAYRYFYIRNVLKFGETWPEAAPYILREGNPTEIYFYTMKCLNGKRWPEGEKVLLSSNDEMAPRYLMEYAAKVIKGRWLEAEPKILRGPSALIIFDYAQACCKGQRIPEIEQALLRSKDEDRSYYLARYAVEIMEERWVEIEPWLFTGKGTAAFKAYIDGLGLNATEFIDELIKRYPSGVDQFR